MKSIITIRKPEDAIASWMETFGFSLDESILHMKDWLEMFQRLQNRSLIIRYDQLDRYPHRAVKSITGFVCGDVNLLETLSLTRKYSKKKVKKFADQIEIGQAGVKGYRIQLL